jgi:ferredoxin--NADP+ reductase
MAAEYNATLVGRAEIVPGSVVLRIEPDKRPFEFEPGQYAVLGLKASEARVGEADADRPAIELALAPAGQPDGLLAVESQAATAARMAADPDRILRRAFCMTSNSRISEYLEFYVTLILSGELTPRLFNLQVGDRLFIGPRAEGIFTLDGSSTKHVLMVATGTGLAPYMSMMRNELEPGIQGRLAEEALGQCDGPRQYVMVHGARTSWDLAFRTELTGLSRRCENFHYIPVITRPHEDDSWSGRTGYLQTVVASSAIEEVTGLVVTPDDFEIFVCGNPDMVDSVIDWAQERGFTLGSGTEQGSIHAEKFW